MTAKMFSLFSKSASKEAILSSRLFTEYNFYAAFTKDIKKARKSVVIESPFLTRNRAVQLGQVFQKLRKRRVKVVIYTRTPNHQPYRLREEAMEAIFILNSYGVTVYECRDYRHRKVAIIDKEILWEGSLNILSQSKSRETMRRIASKPLSRQMLSLITN